MIEEEKKIINSIHHSSINTIIINCKIVIVNNIIVVGRELNDEMMCDTPHHNIWTRVWSGRRVARSSPPEATSVHYPFDAPPFCARTTGVRKTHAADLRQEGATHPGF